MTIITATLAYLPCAWADSVFKFDPFLTTEEKYDDNINLTRSNTRSDWITTVSPGITTSLANPRYNADLTYQPGFVYFLHNPQYDYTSHQLNFAGSIKLNPYFTFSLDENYLRSNEPEFEEMVDTDYERNLRRDSRFIFNRNIIAPKLEYRFGRENLLTLYYRNTGFKSEDPGEDDYRENFIEAEWEQWFDARNGITVLGHFIKGNFDIDTDLLHSIDITPRYRHRFTRHFELYGEYGYGTSDFEERRLYTVLENGRELQTGLEDNEDYDIQKFNAGFEWQLPQNLRLLGSMGYFWRDGEADSDEQGVTSLFTIEKTTRNFLFNLGWESGYSANYFAIRDDGFNKYWEVSAGATYTYHQNLELRARGAYGFEDYTSERGNDVTDEDREDYRYQALIQATYHILRNYGFMSDLAVEFLFNHRERDSDLDSEYYINNQTIARITATF